VVGRVRPIERGKGGVVNVTGVKWKKRFLFRPGKVKRRDGRGEESPKSRRSINFRGRLSLSREKERCEKVLWGSKKTKGKGTGREVVEQ